jgi:hypothetical protein
MQIIGKFILIFPVRSKQLNVVQNGGSDLTILYKRSSAYCICNTGIGKTERVLMI